MPPLNAERLQPTRHHTKNAVLSIVENSEVVVELTKKKLNNEERVVDVCRISSDGLRVSIVFFTYPLVLLVSLVGMCLLSLEFLIL